MPDPTEKPLWQLGLDWLFETIGGSTHPLDRARARRLARGMRMLGEHPPFRAVSAYVGELWRSWPQTASMVRTCWRSVYRARTSLGRDLNWENTPLYEPDLLIERHGIDRVTEVRLGAVAQRALDAFLEAAAEADADAYIARRHELDAALTAVHHLRFLRHGSQALGLKVIPAEPPRRPRWC
jgi:hypothetical protein